VEPHLLKLQENMVVLLEMQTSMGSRLQTKAFYDWLCRVLVWITRWFRWYAQYINSNTLQCRFWITEKNDSKNFVYKPQWKNRWDKFIQCRGNIPCLYPASPKSGSINGGGNYGSGSQSFGDSSFSSPQAIDVGGDNIPKEELFDFTNCTLYEDCKDEQPIAVTVPINGTYYHGSSGNITNPVPQDAYADPENNVPFITLLSGMNKMSSPASILKQSQENKAAKESEGPKDNREKTKDEAEDAPHATEEDYKKLPAREMEHEIVAEIRSADELIHKAMLGARLSSTSSKSIVVDANYDGRGEIKHLLADLPVEVENDLPGFMRREEDQGFENGSSSNFDEILAVSKKSSADGLDERIRV